MSERTGVTARVGRRRPASVSEVAGQDSNILRRARPKVFYRISGHAASDTAVHPEQEQGDGEDTRGDDNVFEPLPLVNAVNLQLAPQLQMDRVSASVNPHRHWHMKAAQ